LTEHTAFIIARILFVVGVVSILEAYVFRKTKKVSLILLLAGMFFITAGFYWHSDLIKDRRRVVPSGEENIFLNNADKVTRYKKKIFTMLEHLKELQLESKNCDYCLEKESKVEKYYQDGTVDLSRFTNFYRNDPDPKFFAAILQIAAIGDSDMLDYFLGSLYLQSSGTFIEKLNEIPKEEQISICRKTRSGLMDNPVSSDDKMVTRLEGICSFQSK
jgi:hypothetical protein